MKSFLNFLLRKQFSTLLPILLFLLPATAAIAQTTLIVGFTDNRPAVFRDGNGAPQGIYVDVLNYIASQEGWVLDYQPGMWTDNYRKVQAGEIDLLLDIGVSPERMTLMAFSSEALVEDWARVFVVPDLQVSDFGDLEGKRVGLVKDDIHTSVFLEIVSLLGIEPVVVLTKSSEESMTLLNEGELDAIVLPNLQSKVVTHQVTCVKTDLIFNPIELRFAAPLDGDPHILDRIDYHVALLKGRPTSIYHKSMTKWVEGVGRIVIPKWLNSAWLIGGVAGLIGLVILFNILLRRQVKIKTNALKTSIALQQKQESELGVAKDIQLGLLPQHSFNLADYDLSAYLEPAKMVGGDFFDFFKLPGDRFCFLIADVADKGVPAALFMAATKTCLTVLAKRFESVARLMASVNGVVSENNPRCMFVTMFCAVLDVKTGVFSYTLAGHDPPFLLRAGGEVQILNQAHSMALGLDEDAVFEQAEVVLQPGDTLFMFTDGVSEALNENGEQFGEEAIKSMLCKGAGLSSAEMVASVKDAVQAHVGQTAPHDDITMLCVRRAS